jgi:transcriptional regulator with XRE-family HTH domain
MKRKRKTGRPLKLNAKEKARIVKMARYGLTDDQMADVLSITQQTLNNYKRRDPEFFESLKSAKAVIDAKVEQSLLKRALGYEYQEEYATKDGAVECRKQAHPDVTACIFWLKNRKRTEWKDRHDVDPGEELKGVATSISAFFRQRYEKEAPRLAAGEDPAVVLFGRAPGGNGNGNGQH